jgi:transposase
METAQRVIGGVDTHKDAHVVVALDHLGRQLGASSFPSTGTGCRDLLGWLRQFGDVERVGVEGCGSYGAGLARLLRSENVEVIEICRPNRQARRRRGKSDLLDAEAAARAVLAERDLVTPKSADGPVEAMRALRVARNSAIKARDQATNQLHALMVTAPQDARDRFADEGRIDKLVTRLIEAEPCAISDQAGYEAAVRSLAKRWQTLDREAAELAVQLKTIVGETAPTGLLELQGVGPDVAAALMIAAGDNPERLRSEASFAALCGVSPLDCSSGKQDRHRLNRGGNRDANMALWRIVMVRLRWDPTTRAYIDKRISEGKTRRGAMRCLKRYIARDVYRLLTAPAAIPIAA